MADQDSQEKTDPVNRLLQVGKSGKTPSKGAAPLNRLMSVGKGKERSQREDIVTTEQEREEVDPNVSRTLAESRKELNMPTSFPGTEGFATAESSSTQVGPVEASPQRIVSADEGKKIVEKLVQDDESLEPVAARRGAVREIQGFYQGMIEEAEDEGDQERVSTLKAQLESIRDYDEDLFKRHKQEFRKDRGIFDVLRQVKKSGQSMLLASTGNVIASYDGLKIFDHIDKTGELPEDFRDGGPSLTKRYARPYLAGDEEKRAELRQRVVDHFNEEHRRFRELRQAIQGAPIDPAAEKFLSASGWGEAFEALSDDPLPILSEVVFGNAAQFASFALAGTVGALGGPGGASLSIGATAAWMERGTLIFEELERKGVDVDDEDAVRKAFEDEELIEDVKSNVQKGSGIYGFLTGLTGFAGAMRFIPKGNVNQVTNFLGREVTENILQTGVQGTLGASAEIGSQVARLGEVESPGGAIAEFIGEGAFAPFKAYSIKRALRASRMSKAVHAENEYLKILDLTRAAEAERSAAVEANQPARIREADLALANLSKGRRSLLESNTDRIVERLEMLESKVNRAETKGGAKALSRPDIKIALAEIDNLNQMLAEADVQRAETTETRGDTDANEQTTQETVTQEEQVQAEAEDVQTGGERTGESTDQSVEAENIVGSLPEEDQVFVAFREEGGTVYSGRRGDAHINLIGRYDLDPDQMDTGQLESGFIDSEGQFFTSMEGGQKVPGISLSRQADPETTIPPAQVESGTVDKALIPLAEKEVGNKVSFRAEKTDGSGQTATQQRVLQKDDAGYFVVFRGEKRYLNMRRFGDEDVSGNDTLASRAILEPGVSVGKNEVFTETTETGTQGKVYFRGTNEGDTRRIETGNKDWDENLFVSKERSSAENYGDNIETITPKEDARIIEEGTPEFKSIFGTLKQGQRVLEWASAGIKKAKDQGIDIVEFKRQGDIGTVIINESSVNRNADAGTPVESSTTHEKARSEIERLDREINRFETLDDPTPADNDHLMFLRERKEKLQNDPSVLAPDLPKTPVEKADKPTKQTVRSILSKYERNPENWGLRNTIVSREEGNKIKDRLLAAQGSLHMGISPKMVADTIKLAVYNIEAGVREFHDFAHIMIQEVGEQVIPRLRTIYEQGIKELGLDRSEFSDKVDIDRDLRQLTDIWSGTREEVASISDAESYIDRVQQLADPEIRAGMEYEGLMELAKAHMVDSSDGANSLLDFIEAVRKKYPNQFDRSKIRSAWTAALSKAEESSRAYFPAKLHERFGIPIEATTFHVGLGTAIRKRIQDSFIHVKRAQEAVMRERGDDFFSENEQLDAYLVDDLMRGMVHEIQWEMTSMENKNSMIRQVYQEAANRGLQTGDWATYYRLVETAQKLERDGKNKQASEVMRQAVESIKNDEVQQFLHAQHAEERNSFLVERINDRLRELHEELDAIPDIPENKTQRAAIKAKITNEKKKVPEAQRGSGLTNEQASDILQRFRDEGKYDDLVAVSEKVQAMVDKTLDYRVEFGLNGEQEISEYRDRWSAYVPLERIMETDSGVILDDAGRSSASMVGPRGIKGTGFKRAYGSDRPVDNILGTITANFDTIVMAGAKNQVWSTMAAMFDSEWSMGNETLGRSMPKAAAEAANINENTAMILDYRVPKEDGTMQDRRLIFEDKDIYDTVAEYSSGGRDGVVAKAMNGFRGFMNYLRFVRTSASVNFMIANPQRDIGVVMANMASDFNHATSAKFLKDMFYKDGRFLDAQRSVWDFIKGKDTPGAKEYRELRRLGGTTGFYQFRDRADILKDLQRAQGDINKIATGKPTVKQAFRSFIRGIEQMNEVAENATRLSAYRIAMENGMSPKRAAQYALNVNTNFNKAGDWGALFKLGYQFANSAIQGHTRMARAAKINPKAFAKTAFSLMALGSAVNEYNDWMNEEEHRRLKKNHPWMFNTNLVFLDGEGNIAFKLFLPFGYNTFKAMGDNFNDVVMGRIDAETASARTADAFMDAFNPFRGAQMFTGGLAGVMLAATPTAIQPLTELSTNQSFFGTIYPPMQFALQERLGIPDRQLKYDNVDPYADYITRFLARETKGEIDVSPETIEHMISFISGTAGREWNNLFRRSLTTDEAQMDGIDLGISTSDGQNLKIRPNMIPILNRFVRVTDQDREAMSSIYNSILRDLPDKSFDVNGEEFQTILNDLSTDYEVVLQNDIVDDQRKGELQEAINSFVNTVHKNYVRDEAIAYFKENGLTGRENREARKRYYDNVNRRVRATRVPHMTRTGTSSFRSDPYGNSNSVIMDKNLIDLVEEQVDDLRLVEQE